jgi:heme-degrading monooxygenase HmoA
MIARLWRGAATSAKADDYFHHFDAAVAPNLKNIEGHKGALLLRRNVEGHVEFLAVTLWDSIETIKRFAGPKPEVAIVEPEGRAALSSFDDFATHFEVAHRSVD